MRRLLGTQPRMTGNVHARIPRSAPLAYRLPNEVYALDGYITVAGTGEPGVFERYKLPILAGAAGALALWWVTTKKKRGRR